MNTPLNFAVMGNPIKHSYSPRLHALFAKQAGLNIHYEKILVPLDGFEIAVKTFFEQGGKGLNITVPFKLQAYELAKANLSPRARLAGSVNTLWMKSGHLHGCNTDGIGMVNDIQRQGISLENKKILLLGAGGAARGVILPLLETGCRQLLIVNRTATKASELVQQCLTDLPQYAGVLSAGGFEQIQGQWDLVINATSSSLQQNALPLPTGLFTNNSLAYDMVYTPENDTPFLQQARQDGATLTSDGLGMLVYQGAESFFIWNQVRINPAPVLEALRQELLAG
ncbi:shikimate dehydrogenase [Advenella sp. RU8]|uniref:shikimate dehydrogenase n=1 Tax=Advenella sp. RU8 TaxID=3399575 RepID=UPI003AADC368